MLKQPSNNRDFDAAIDAICLLQAALYVIDGQLQTARSAIQAAMNHNAASSVLVITMAPRQKPVLEFSDSAELMKSQDRCTVMQDKKTGLMALFLEGELIEDHNSCYVIGPMVLFQCDDAGELCSVTSEDLRLVRETYGRNTGRILLKNGSFPAIVFHPVGDRIP